MLAAPIAAQKQYGSGPRPINLGRDVRPVLTLLNTCFGPVRDHHGRAIADRFSLSQSGSFARRLSLASRGFVPGFVWEESGQIVGNVTLLESPLHGRYLVANVAVHPDFRRRGIARALMQEALGHIESWNGHQVLLQVESDNAAALDLYHSMAFDELGVVQRWQGSADRLRYPGSEMAAGPQPRALRRREWRAAFDLDLAGFSPDLNWPAPPPPDHYKTGLLQRAADLFNGRHQSAWVVDGPNGEDKRLIGLAGITSEWGRPHQLRLCILPEWHGRLEGPLLNITVEHLRRLRGNVWLSYPASSSATDELFRASNLYLGRSLTVMRKYLGVT